MLLFFETQLKPLIKSISEEVINDVQYNECIKCIEYYQGAEYRNEPIVGASLIAPSCLSANVSAALAKSSRKDVYKRIWIELEGLLKCYQDVSERHRILYSHVRNMVISTLRSENARNRALSAQSTPMSTPKSDEINAQV